MIELKAVSKKYIKNYYTLFNANTIINQNTLFINKDNASSVCLFRLISKIDSPSSGDIYIENLNLKKIKHKNLQICYLPQNPILFENKNIFNNLMYPLRLRKFNKNTAKTLVNEAILNLNFDKKIKKVKELSLPQKKLLALVRGSLWQPKYMLFENFFENLTPTYFDLAINLINEISKTTIILASVKDDFHMPCYENFKRIKIENGNLIN